MKPPFLIASGLWVCLLSSLHISCSDGSLGGTLANTGDICFDLGWYNDGECDSVCNEPDPDCGGTATETQGQLSQLVNVTDPSSTLAYLLTDASGNAISTLGAKDAEGRLTDINGAAYVDTAGHTALVELDATGRPQRIVVDSKVMDFSNYTLDSVQISFVLNGTTTTQLVQLDDLMKASLSALQSARWRWHHLRQTNDVDPQILLGAVKAGLESAGHILGVAGCLAALVDPTLLSAVGCGSYLVSLVTNEQSFTNELSGNTGTAVGLVECAFLHDAASCLGVTTDIATAIADTIQISDHTAAIEPQPPSVVDDCQAYGWYGDGICDDFCAQPDPDCASSADECPSLQEASAGISAPTSTQLLEPGSVWQYPWTNNNPYPVKICRKFEVIQTGQILIFDFISVGANQTYTDSVSTPSTEGLTIQASYLAVRADNGCAVGYTCP